MRFFLFVLLAITITTLISSCGSSYESVLYGSWTFEKVDTSQVTNNFYSGKKLKKVMKRVRYAYWEFFDDNSFVMNFRDGKMYGTWSLSEDLTLLQIRHRRSSKKGELEILEINDDKMIVRENNGVIVTYKKD
ncbi:MAG: hypothetical protein K9J16_01785 [Melioribacteraceae bacterium]|nr:hypothetical protein [Melioribacteraceae bacterium]MCF8352996.1 hypothetical protein [Melioribacteraceae bacterium]MCF8392887.1 hypothetical protein [Melioribacteraceae bacterium]MCF8417819.1 hypothetical protein [Melioribacteraceae bacterium]